MSAKLISHALRPIYDKVVAGERVTDAEALALYASNDLNGARHDRERGARAEERERRDLHPQPIHQLLERLPALVPVLRVRREEARGACVRAGDRTRSWRRCGTALAQGVTEVHMVGGLHPTLKGEWYLDLLRALRALDAELFIKAFTAIEIRHLAERVFREPIRATLERLREAGLGAITGGGAEIFAPEIREQICRGKESAEEWLEVHRTWHEMGMRSTATMLFGHIETPAHRVDHLRRLRELQDETRGFTGFIPFAFEPDGARADSVLANLPHATAFEELRNLAVARIYLDNFDHITAYWVSLGLPLAQQALNYGVDDLHGTIMEEKIFHMAGATNAAGTDRRRDGKRDPRSRPRADAARHVVSPHPARAARGSCSKRAREALSRAGARAPRLRAVSQLEAADLRLRRAGGLRASVRAWRAISRAARSTWRWCRCSRRCVRRAISRSDDVAIACDGPVFSVFLAHRGPLAEVRRIALDPASLTSVHLLRVLLAEFHGLRPIVRWTTQRRPTRSC